MNYTYEELQELLRTKQKELDAALEREKALAAHVEKVQLLADSDRVDDEFYDEDGDLRQQVKEL